MLNTIPFHGILMRKELKPGLKASTNHVLVYCAIEAHALGEKGCIASNSKIGKEIGISQGRVANIISDLSQAGWITVILDNNNQRKLIVPNAQISFTPVKNESSVNPPSLYSEPPLHSTVNIDNNLDNNTSYRAAEAAASSKKELDYDDKKETSTANKLFWLVIKKYALPVTNANHIRKWSEMIGAMDDGTIYLSHLLNKDLRDQEGNFKPTLNTPHDILQKKLMIQRFYNGGEDKKAYDPRVFG